MAEQHGHIFHRNTAEQDFNRECVAETMGPQGLDARLHRGALKTIPPSLGSGYSLDLHLQK
jgi:hypothetical protein